MKIIVTDKRQWIEGKETNGGGYIFTLTFIPAAEGYYLVKFGTSSEFPYCSRAGHFTDCCNCSDFVGGNCKCNFDTTRDPLAYSCQWLGVCQNENMPEGIEVSCEI